MQKKFYLSQGFISFGKVESFPRKISASNEKNNTINMAPANTQGFGDF